MRSYLAALTVPLILVALGVDSRGSFSAPLVQHVVGEGVASFQRVDLQRAQNRLKRCFDRKGARSCRGVSAAPNGARASSTASPATLPIPSSLPPGASFGRTYGNHQSEPKPREPKVGSSSSGPKFTGGLGVPNNRVTLEGALSPYQLPNGNTGASTGKLNGIEAQGMHFGLEWHY